MRWLCPGIVAAVAFLVAWVAVRHRTAGHPLAALRAWLGFGRGVRDLSRILEMPSGDLRKYEPYYRRHSIPKRSGGFRTLFIPDDETKALQRRILRRVLAGLRAHPAATGFERGKSILDNALPHAGRAVVVRTDVVDFFPTTRAERVEAYFRRIGWNAAAARVLTHLTTWDGGLPQGAPTSPRLSNLVNFHLDHLLARHAEARYGGRYTRYADDITFSFEKDRGRRVRGILQITRRTLRGFGYRMHRRKKLSVRRRHERQVVTGLVVNDRPRLPRATRRWLRAVRHHRATGRPMTLTEAQLQGWTAFEHMLRRDGTGSA